MGQFRGRLALFASAAVMLMASTAQASITRVSNPTDIVYEPRVFVKFDAAFDSINRVYLAVWGTQFAGPVNKWFKRGRSASHRPVCDLRSLRWQPAGRVGPVIYSAQEGKFLVSYTKILAPNVHGKAVRVCRIFWRSGDER